MKTIGSVKEDLATEKRVAITPETTKKFVDLNFSIKRISNLAFKKTCIKLKNLKKSLIFLKVFFPYGRLLCH